MNKYIVFLILFSVNMPLFAQVENNNIKRYFIESAHIKYKYSGNTTGTEDLKFDRWGEREYRLRKTQTSTVFYSVKNLQKENTLYILDSIFAYSIDLSKKIGVKTFNRNQKLAKKNGSFSSEPIGKEMLKNIGAIIIKEEKVLGKTCSVWKANGLEVWMWNGIPLKIKSYLVGKKRVSEAIEMEIGIKLDDSLFRISEKIKIIDYTKE